jgi:hypothetical protein
MCGNWITIYVCRSKYLKFLTYIPCYWLSSGSPTIISKNTTGDAKAVDTKINLGGSAVLIDCAADADPPASYSWTRIDTHNNTTSVGDIEPYKQYANGSLKINPTTLLVGGMYGKIETIFILCYVIRKSVCSCRVQKNNL